MDPDLRQDAEELDGILNLFQDPFIKPQKSADESTVRFSSKRHCVFFCDSCVENILRYSQDDSE